MRTVAIIQARMGSTRLPNKVLMTVLGKPLLGWMLERLSTCVELSDIIVATTTNSRDDVIAAFCKSLGFKIYRGSEDDVLDRYYQAARLFEADAVVRLTADCPLIDPVVVDQIIYEYAAGCFDFVSNSEPLPSTWPDGMDVSVLGFQALKTAWQNADKPSDREHVTFYFWSNPEVFRCKRIEHSPNWSKYRLTLDYAEDYDVLKKIIEYFDRGNIYSVKSVPMKEIVAFLDGHPDIVSLNNRYSRGLGWVDAFERDLKKRASSVPTS